MRNKKNRLRALILWALTLGWIALLFTLSGQSADQSGALSGRLVRLVLRLFPDLPLTAAELSPILRKSAHFAIFGVQGFLLCLAITHSLPRGGAALSALACGALAALNEYHQTFAEGRSCELRDVCIDFGGALLGIFAALLLRGLLRRVRKRRRNVIIS